MWSIVVDIINISILLEVLTIIKCEGLHYNVLVGNGNKEEMESFE